MVKRTPSRRGTQTTQRTVPAAILARATAGSGRRVELDHMGAYNFTIDIEAAPTKAT